MFCQLPHSSLMFYFSLLIQLLSLVVPPSISVSVLLLSLFLPGIMQWILVLWKEKRSYWDKGMPTNYTRQSWHYSTWNTNENFRLRKMSYVKIVACTEFSIQFEGNENQGSRDPLLYYLYIVVIGQFKISNKLWHKRVTARAHCLVLYWPCI